MSQRLLKNIPLILLIVFGTGLSAQEQPVDTTANSDDLIESDGRIAPPILGVGVSSLTYLGELNPDYSIFSSAVSSRLMYSINFTSDIDENFFTEVYGFIGTASANERSLERNLNFESRIAGVGFQTGYNFGHFLNPNRLVEPILGVGFEFFEFNSKTDLYDIYGVEYNYWSDGTIRNIPEDAENANQATRISRDYIYETDIREQNYDGLGDYTTYSIAIPITAGVNMRISERWDLRFYGTYHYTFTDLIDGVSPAGVGLREGDARDDHFFDVGAKVNYYLKRFEVPSSKEELAAIDALVSGDSDEDGVENFMDKCEKTPAGAEVDEYGCPLDGDQDYVPNYRDDELNSAPEAIVDSIGVTYTDARLNELYLMYMDTIGTYSKIERESYTLDIVAARTKRVRNVNEKTYAIKIGEFEKNIPSDMVDQILSQEGVNTYQDGDKIIVTVGNYDNLPDAMRESLKLQSKGIESGLVSTNREGKVRNLDGSVIKYSESNWPGTKDVLYRVQLGAFSTNANEKVFDELPKVIAVAANDGLTRYYSGEYYDFNKAAEHKLDMIELGFTDAYIVALRGGSKIPMSEAQNTIQTVNREPLTPEERAQLKFHVQVGSYSNAIPTDVLEKFMAMGVVKQVPAPNGVTRFLSGEFTDYDEAKAFRDQLRTEGFEGAFVVSTYKGEYMPAKDAIRLINNK